MLIKEEEHFWDLFSIGFPILIGIELSLLMKTMYMLSKELNLYTVTTLLKVEMEQFI
jgi:hypothetical protein